jgi:hypothetical protein
MVEAGPKGEFIGMPLMNGPPPNMGTFIREFS